MDRAQKEQLVSEMRTRLQEAGLVVVTRQVGLTVDEVSDLRGKVREAQAEYKVMKNTLAQIAVKDTSLEGVSSMFNGPTAVAFSKDPIAAAKAVVQFASKNEKLTIVGGYMDGQVLSAANVKTLASLPSLDELRAKLIGVLVAPATKIATILQEPASRVARVIAAKKA
jgi:large subunit ribosomal protein L10